MFDKSILKVAVRKTSHFCSWTTRTPHSFTTPAISSSLRGRRRSTQSSIKSFLKSLTVELCFYSHLFEDVQGPNATADSHILIGSDDLMCLSLSTINWFSIFLLLRFRLLFRQAIKSLPTLLRPFSRKPLWWFTSSTSSQPSTYCYPSLTGFEYVFNSQKASDWAVFVQQDDGPRHVVQRL